MHAEAVGAPTRSPMKQAAAPPWPDTSETQRETSSVDNYFDKHRMMYAVETALTTEGAAPEDVEVIFTGTQK